MQNVTLDTMGGGALRELFEAELARVLSNISDPNTGTTTKRSITIQVNFRPNQDRDLSDVELKCSSKLAGTATVATRLYIGRHQGKLIAVESDPRQSTLFDDPSKRLAVVSAFPNKEGE